MDREIINVSTVPRLDQETLTRRELGKLFNVSHEAIRIWEENGKLVELGCEKELIDGNTNIIDLVFFLISINYAKNYH